MSVTTMLPAQCADQWTPSGFGLAGVRSGIVNACLSWDPDGAGPRGEVLIAAGGFVTAGSIAASRIVLYDPATDACSSLGSGMPAAVLALAKLPNGDLVAAGDFTSAGGVPCNFVARWDGTSWWPMGAGMSASVHALTLLPNGDLVAGGAFTTADGITCNRIARWDGSAWSPLGTGMDSSVEALTTTQTGDLVAGGLFTSAGGIAANRIARWDGVSWSPLGLGANSTVYARGTLANGNLVAGGAFTSAGGISASRVAQWNGTAWSRLGNGPSGTVRCVTTLPNGDLVAGGSFSTIVGPIPVNGIARWNGTNWSPLGSGLGTTVRSLAVVQGDLVAGGGFGRGLYGWDGANWQALPSGMEFPVDTLVRMSDGRVATRGGRYPTHQVGVWDGSTWAVLSQSLTGLQRLVTLPDGRLAAAYYSTGPGVAAWNGSGWTDLSAPWPADGTATLHMASSPGGQLAVARYNLLAVSGEVDLWNGVSWSSAGSMSGPVSALTWLPDGDLIAAGSFTAIGGVTANHVARWDGSTWQPLGSGLPFVADSLVALPGGAVAAGGGQSVARWDGSNWTSLGSGMSNGTVLVLAVLPDGDLVAAGNFTAAGGVPAQSIARWNGSAWEAIDGGLSGSFAGSVAIVRSLLMTPEMGLVAGGDFLSAGSIESPNLTVLNTSCPASTVNSGAGCTGSGGPNTLAAATLPWIGSMFQVQGTGFPANSFAIHLVGIMPTSMPLTALHPAGLPGCSLWTLGEVQTNFLFPVGGAASIGIPIPTDPFLVGLVARAQMASVELDLAANITAISTSNAIDFTLGQY